MDRQFGRVGVFTSVHPYRCLIFVACIIENEIYLQSFSPRNHFYLQKGETIQEIDLERVRGGNGAPEAVQPNQNS
jgi:hypothetical protein